MQILRRYWLLIVIVIFWFGRGFFPAAPSDNEHLEELLHRGKSVEALKWANEVQGEKPYRTVFEYDNAESLKIIKDLYEMGAEVVTAIDIESDPKYGETTNMLIVSLPNDPKARQNIFAFAATQARRSGFGPTADRGQKLLMLFWT